MGIFGKRRTALDKWRPGKPLFEVYGPGDTDFDDPAQTSGTAYRVTYVRESAAHSLLSAWVYTIHRDGGYGVRIHYRYYDGRQPAWVRAAYADDPGDVTCDTALAAETEAALLATNLVQGLIDGEALPEVFAWDGHAFEEVA